MPRQSGSVSLAPPRAGSPWASRVPHPTPRRTGRMPPAGSTGITAAAMPSLRLRDFIAFRADLHLGHGAEVPDLEVDATIELLTLLPRIVTEGCLLADSNDLDRRLGHAQLDQELLDRL